MNKEPESVFDVFCAWAGAPFIDVDFVTNVRISVAQLLEKAEAKNAPAVEEICLALAQDLVDNPCPTPVVMRGFLLHDFLRGFGLSPPLFRFRKWGKWETIKNAVGMIRALRALARYRRQGYFYYDLRRYADGYVALVENDYKSVLSAIAAISSVLCAEQINYSEAKRAFSSLGQRNKEGLVTDIRDAGCAVIAGPDEDRHLRNALVHGSYSVDGGVLRYEDRQFRDEIPIHSFIAKLMRLRAINELVASVLVRDKQMKEKVSRHWDPECWPPASG